MLLSEGRERGELRGSLTLIGPVLSWTVNKGYQAPFRSVSRDLHTVVVEVVEVADS